MLGRASGDDWSTKYLEYDKDEIARLLTSMLCDRLRVARPNCSTQVLTVGGIQGYQTTRKVFLSDNSATLYVGGDWTVSARVEGAWESGTAISAIFEQM